MGSLSYLHSLRDAFIEEGKDRIDPFRIDQDAIDKARNAFLSVLTVADEMWLRGTIRRVGPLMFKCFYFMQDNFRIYKHYHDMMRYFEFPDQEMLRDIQICYLEVAIQKETVDLSEYKGLTEHDRKYFELIRLLSNPLMKFDRGMAVPAEISESDLLKVIGEGEKRLQVLMDTQTDERIGFDRLHQDFINLYGNGILRFHWKAISEVKRHAKAIVHPLEAESLEIYVRELEADDFAASEQEYIRYFEKHRDVISFNQLCHFYTRHGRIAKTKELYDNVFDEYRFLIENQSEYFYRVYISFYVENGFDLTAPIRCYVEHGDEIKDSYLKLFFETELDFATATFNNPDYMLDNARVLLEEGVIEKQDYNRRCLIINMLNCRPLEAEKFADSDHEKNPYLASGYERMLFVWMRHPVVPNPHWNSMQSWSMEQLNQTYSEEPWHKPVQEILDACGMCSRRAIVVDLWAIYYLQKLQWPEFMNCFDKVYVTHDTVSMALQEIMEVNDDDIRGVLANFQNARNLIIQSPTIKDQLEIRSPKFKYMEIHQALLLAEILDCPAFVGEFRYPIPEHFRSRVIRPYELDDLYECMEVILMRK